MKDIFSKKHFHFFQYMGILLILASTPLSAQEIDANKLKSEIKSYLEQRADEGKFSGTILIAKDGQAIYKAAHGLANRTWSIPNAIDTKFNLGSMNKMFTAVAITQLMERGKLSFDDTVGKLIPSYPNKDVANKVTVRHLLTHTSGMGSYFNQKYVDASKNRFRAVDDYDELYVDEALSFDPGERFQYSNSGFMLLGKIVEAVSGQDYFEFIRENISKPAGMINSDCYELDLIIPNLAEGYTTNSLGGPSDGQVRSNIFMHVLKGGPAGGGYSTVEDLLNFANALFSGKLISDKSRDLITSKFGTNNYGHGFIAGTPFGMSYTGHSGGFLGINSELRIFPELGYTIVVMSNIDSGATPVANKVVQLLAGR